MKMTATIHHRLLHRYARRAAIYIVAKVTRIAAYSKMLPLSVSSDGSGLTRFVRDHEYAKKTRVVASPSFGITLRIAIF
jgi:hypothetical protein